jgi:transketolase
VYENGVDFQLGKAIVHGIGTEVSIIACGTPVAAAKQAVEALRAEGRSVGLIDMHTIKPLDEDAIVEASARSKVILTVEEHNVLGGLGGAVAEVLAERGKGARLVRHGIYDEYSLIAPPTHLYRHYRLDAAGIKNVVLEQI